MLHSENQLIEFNPLVVKICITIFLFWGSYSVLGVTLQGLPATVNLQENRPSGTEVFCFKIGFSTRLLNSNPLTNDFIVYMVNSTHAKVLLINHSILSWGDSFSEHLIQE